MENPIKDLPDFVKDSKSKAVILKRKKSPIDIKIENLELNIKTIEKSFSELYNKLKSLDEKVDHNFMVVGKYLDASEQSLRQLEVDVMSLKYDKPNR